MGYPIESMRRVLVVGSSGAGKSTLARAIAARRGLRHIELDALFHGPGWTPRETFAEDVHAATEGDDWVADGNYAPVADRLWARADTVVWVDLPRLLVEAQVIWRSLLRWVRDEELWNGNRERGPIGWLDPEHPIRWSWNKFAGYEQRYGSKFADPAFAHVEKHRLKSRAEVARFLARL